MVETDPTEQLKAVASQVLSGDQLNAFMAVADAKRLADDHGNIDAEKISAGLRTLYGITETPQAPRQWGQTTGQPAGSGRVGDAARAALEKRHGVKNADDQPGPGGQITRGAGGRAALERRHPKGQK